VISWYECWKIKMKGKFRRSISPEVPDDVLQINGQYIPFVNNVTYLGATFNGRLTWKTPYQKDCSQGLFPYSKVSI
jgi:hypothetical protein